MLKKIRQILKKKGGFSLIELLVVIAIMGVIALVAVPNVIGAMDSSKKNSDKANASSIATAVTAAMASGKTVTATRAEFVNASPFEDVITEFIQSAPTVKYTGTGGALSTDTSFYVTVSDGSVIVYAHTSDGKDAEDYTELFPTPETGSKWAD